MPTNTHPISLSFVYGSGDYEGLMDRRTFKPGETVYDNQGLIHSFSILYEDGTLGNFVLLPDNEYVDIAFTIAEKILIPLGLKLSMGRLFRNSGTEIRRLADLNERYLLTPFVQENIRNFNMNNFYSYYEITTGEKIFRDPIFINV